MALIEQASRAARILLDHAYVRLVARDEPDAVCAAALLAHALRREGIDFHATFVPRLGAPESGALAAEAPEALVLVGLSGDAAPTPLPGARRVAIDRGRGALEADATLDASRASDARGEGSLA
ncbi:MAG TPA: hypothetical protein VHH36_01295, partial [Candidatus Thermoplasmatota archaeon]|nr:hypothetical protein [Candidatus Thermoplasmatota archaeon]